MQWSCEGIGTLRLADAAAQRWLRLGNFPELDLQVLIELQEIVGAAVGQLPLQQPPDRFFGIEFWGVAGKVFDVQPRAPSTEVPKRCSLMDAAIIEQCDNVPSKVAEHFAQECHDLFLSDVVVEEHAKQSQSLSTWAHGYARDH